MKKAIRTRMNISPAFRLWLIKQDVDVNNFHNFNYEKQYLYYKQFSRDLNESINLDKLQECEDEGKRASSKHADDMLGFETNY